MLDGILRVPGNSDKLLWFRNDGGSPPAFLEQRIDSRPGWHVVDVDGGDLDGDGDTDFFAVMQEDPGSLEEIVWIEDVGSAYTRHSIELENDLGAQSNLLAFDADDDGDLDLVLADRTEDTVT